MSEALQDFKTDLKRTPLDGFHRRAGARMVPFAGYHMPLNYAGGIIAEHRHVRSAAGLFDISHMGQLTIRARSGDPLAACTALEALVPMDLRSLAVGRQRYALLTDECGGILDDLMVARMPDGLFVVVNASRKDADEKYLREKLSATCDIERRDDRALMALQGPLAAKVLEEFAPGVSDLAFMDVRGMKILGRECIVARSGYTGEDGFEISVPAEIAEQFAQALAGKEGVKLIGLGARDSLRLEAGLCLYGSDIDENTTPVEASLAWAIQKSRRPGGERAGGFPGERELFRELNEGPSRRRVGLRPEGRASIRHGARLFESETTQEPIGHVTSGCFGPTVNAPVAMGYVKREIPEGAIGFAELREKRIPTKLVPLPFVQPSYKRSQK
jgi:aminomethyltransferase